MVHGSGKEVGDDLGDEFVGDLPADSEENRLGGRLAAGIVDGGGVVAGEHVVGDQHVDVVDDLAVGGREAADVRPHGLQQLPAPRHLDRRPTRRRGFHHRHPRRDAHVELQPLLEQLVHQMEYELLVAARVGHAPIHGGRIIMAAMVESVEPDEDGGIQGMRRRVPIKERDSAVASDPHQLEYCLDIWIYQEEGFIFFSGE